MVWWKGGLECKWEVRECSEKVYCVPCCAKCEDKCFCEHNTPWWLEPHACVMHVRADDQTKLWNTARGKSRVRESDIACRFGVLCTPPRRLQGNRPCLQAKTPLSPLKKISLIPWWRFPPWSCLPTWGWRTCWRMVVPLPTRFGVDTLGTLFDPSKLLTSSLSNLILGMESGVALSKLLYSLS